MNRPRNLRVRNLDAMAKNQPSHLRPLTLRFLSGLIHALDLNAFISPETYV
ncbi:hypothetical protein LPA06_07090 [Lacticaseibacillus paracasei subsp. tolerans]|nr:hypothetical protein LPA06_07090 [Lacticaseibacillus paracasei subsp. tolerans]